MRDFAITPSYLGYIESIGFANRKCQAYEKQPRDCVRTNGTDDRYRRLLLGMLLAFLPMTPPALGDFIVQTQAQANCAYKNNCFGIPDGSAINLSVAGCNCDGILEAISYGARLSSIPPAVNKTAPVKLNDQPTLALLQKVILLSGLEQKMVYVSSHPLNANTTVVSWRSHYKVPSNFDTAWFYFIDDAPRSENVSHK